MSPSDKVDWTGVIGKDGKSAAVSMDGEARVTMTLFQGTYNVIATPWLGLTPTPAPDLGPPTGFIDSLQARVLELQFFEGASDWGPSDPRVYSQSFSQFSTRYIYWELGLIHPAPGQQSPIEITAVYTRSGGALLTQHIYNGIILASGVSSTHIKGFGFSDSGNWAIGSYRVDLTVDGVLVASEGFQVTE